MHLYSLCLSVWGKCVTVHQKRPCYQSKWIQKQTIWGFYSFFLNTWRQTTSSHVSSCERKMNPLISARATTIKNCFYRYFGSDSNPSHKSDNHDRFHQPTRYSLSSSTQCFQPRLAFSPFCLHTSLSPSQVTRHCKTTCIDKHSNLNFLFVCLFHFSFDCLKMFSFSSFVSFRVITMSRSAI